MDGLSAGFAELLARHEATILSEWMDQQTKATTARADLMTDTELREDSRRFFALVRQAMASGAADIHSASWSQTRDFLGTLSAARAAVPAARTASHCPVEAPVGRSPPLVGYPLAGARRGA